MGAYARPDYPGWASAGGLRHAVFSRSLGLVMGALFLLSWLTQSLAGTAAYNDSRAPPRTTTRGHRRVQRLAGTAAYNEQQLRQLQDPVDWGQYVASADFWSRSLQNWQSELLAVASMAILSVYLRQRGSPESKPVGTPHASTGIEG